MAFRSFSRSRRSSGRRRSFGRRRMRPPVQTTRWETANFFAQTVQTTAADTLTTNAIELLKIQGHFGAAAGLQRSLEAITRRIEIGGIVFNYATNTTQSAAVGAVGGRFFWGQYLFIDRLDGAGNVAALPDWLVTAGPVSTNPGGLTDEADYPTRVLWRDNGLILPAAVTTGIVNNASLQKPRLTVNLRIRRFLDDHHGLYINHYTFNNATAATVEWHAYTWGTIYYRYVFGH